MDSSVEASTFQSLIRSLLKSPPREMARAVAAGNQNGFLGLSETLNMLMQQHNLKEENMLYPMSDQVLGDEGASLIREMEASAGQRSA